MLSDVNISSMVEDILSDEYEEGEILDDDILYENVSSLEEFSDGEDGKHISKVGNKTECKVKSKRKKEHKCKDDSPCRRERSGKHCYARIRKRGSSYELKFKSSSGIVENDRRYRLESNRPSSPRGGCLRESNRDAVKKRGKTDDKTRCQPSYYHHDNRLPQKRPLPARRTGRRRNSGECHREDKKRKSNSPPRVKLLVESNWVVAKSSLLDRLVGSGSIQRTVSENEENKSDSVTPQEKNEFEEQSEYPAIERSVTATQNVDEKTSKVSVESPANLNVCPAEIPVPPTSNSMSPIPEPQKEEIDELHLRLVALRTAIIKKHTDLKRKKRLASKERLKSTEDSFSEFALLGLEDECDSVPTPPPPGTDWRGIVLPGDTWSDEDMVIDQENCGDAVIESNIPTSDPSVVGEQRVPIEVSIRSSQDKLPCCKGNPIPVVSQHRPAKELDDRRPILETRSIVPVVLEGVKSQPRTPKYLREIHSNSKSAKGKRGIRKKQRPYLRQRSQGVKKTRPVPKDLTKKPKVDRDDDEDELRQLALLSVKPKTTIKSGMLSDVGTHLNPLHVETGEPPPTNHPPLPVEPSPSEEWEDLDEDILRAQLLSSLSRNIAIAAPEPILKPEPLPLRNPTKVNKENLYSKRNVIHPAKKKIVEKFTKSATPPLSTPIVDRFIIRVSDSSDDEHGESVEEKVVTTRNAAENITSIERSIDRLLEETRKETELIQQATVYYPMFDMSDQSSLVPATQDPPSASIEETAPEFKTDLSLPCEVQEGPSNLSAWQYEELKRQKRVQTLKQSVIEATKQRVRTKNTESTVCSSVDCEKEMGSPHDTELLSCEDLNTSPQGSLDEEVANCLDGIISAVCAFFQPSESSSSLPPVGKTPKDELNPVEAQMHVGATCNSIVQQSMSSTNKISKQRIIPPMRNPIKQSVDTKKLPTKDGLTDRKITFRATGNVLRKATTLKKSPSKPVAIPTAKVRQIKDSSFAFKAVEEMGTLVTNFEEELSDYNNSKKQYVILRKQLALLQHKLSKKRQNLFDMKDTMENKKRFLQSTITMDTSSLSPLPDTRDQPKPSSRTTELLNLKYREVCLRAQFAMMGLEKNVRAVKPTMAAGKQVRPMDEVLRKRLKPRLVERLRPAVAVPKMKPVVATPSVKHEADVATSQKLVVSVANSDKMDPHIPLCPYDMQGVCKDEECKYQHLKN